MPLPVESVYDLIELTHQLSPQVAFVNLEKLTGWSQDGLIRLRKSSMFGQTYVVPFSETWQRHELPDVPGLETGDMLFVPFSIEDLERILDRYPSPAVPSNRPCDELAS